MVGFDSANKAGGLTGKKPTTTKKPKPTDPVAGPLSTSNKTVAAAAAGAPATSDASVAMLGAASRAQFLSFARKPTNTNPTGNGGAKTPTITALRYLKGGV